MLRLNDLRHGVHDLKEPRAGVEAVGRPVCHVYEEIHRVIDHVHVGDKCREQTVREVSAAVYDHPSADSPDVNVAEVEYEARRRERHVLEIRQVLLVRRETLRIAVEAPRLVLFLRERLDDAYAAEYV